jgi:Zn-dependent M28 family amino/carboxypeptidase
MIKLPKILFLTALISTGCSEKNVDFSNALKSFSIEDLKKHVAVLGSDSLMGRMPFSPGEALTVNYLAEQLEQIGFEPAFNGSYFQKVPMVEIASLVTGSEIMTSDGKSIVLNSPDDIAVISPQVQDEIIISESDMIFAGFGINAPEYAWNDYEGLDVKGKTVVVLINDPGLYSGDSSLFRGREMTYYGRWTYKYEEAARQGAAGVLIIHEEEGAGYPYTIPRKSAISPQLYMQRSDNNTGLCHFTGWLSSFAAEKIFETEGLNVSKLRTNACSNDFKGFPLKMKLSLSIRNNIKFNTSTNVAGVLKGNSRSDECIVYTAHWDHFGIGEVENGDSIYNGAVDNGTSMAWEFSIGKAFAGLKNRPARSIVLLFPTAEEQGLIGSMYYAENPVFSLGKTVACINNDLLLPIGKMKDVMITGFGASELDDMVVKAAAAQNRYVVGDPNSHTGMYFRSDHFAFAKKGVPSLFARGNTDSREFGKVWAAKQEQDYIVNRYHRPADNYVPEEWNFEGIREDAMLAFQVGYELATSDFFPGWKPGSEFKDLRKK